MRPFASLPARTAKGFQQWNGPVRPAAELLFQGLEFEPEEVQLSIENGIYPAAELLGLTVPWRGETGTVEVEPGYFLEYAWCSIDGRGTDWLKLTGAVSKEPLLRLLERLDTALSPVRQTDLLVVVRGATLEPDPF